METHVDRVMVPIEDNGNEKLWTDFEKIVDIVANLKTWHKTKGR
jgi:hypothetical protein